MPVQKVYLLNQTTPVNIPSGLVPKGAYAAGTDYAVGDSVDYNGSSYVMFVDAAAGTAPTDTTKWQVLANKGATGATGSTGAAGSNGTNGTNGIDGKTILNGAVDPTTEGVDGDFYINTTSDEIFGPKTAGVWGTGTSIVGPAGTNGTNGAGVVVGGTTGQVLAKIDATDYNTQWVNQSGGIADPGSNGILARTALNTTSARTITGTANQVTVTNGDGVSGNPTLSLPQNIDTSATPTFSSLTAGTATDVLGTALSVIRNNVAVGRIDNNASGLRVQAQNGSLQLRGTGNTGIAIDASGNAVVAGTITGANLSGTNTGDNATNSQYSGLDAAKVNKAGDTMTGNLNMGTNKLIGGTRITDVLKLQGTTDNGTLTSPAIQLLTGNNGATTALTVLNNGNVGIGTTSPGAKLQIDTGAATTIGQIIKGASAQTADYLQIRTSGATAGDILAVKSSGRVGIGVSDPQAALEIAGDIETTIGANRKLKLSSATAYWYDLQSTNDDFQIIEASDVNKVRLTIKYPNGNVGIGNTAPGAKLQIDTGAAATIGQIIKGATSQTADLLQIQDSSANKLMVVSSGGNVGIGVAAPATPLEVNGIVRADRTAVPAQYIQLDGGDGNNTALRAVAANKFLYIDNSDTSGTNLYNAIVFRNGTAGDTERMRVDANGNVGIGTTSPSEKLVISGTVKATGYKSSDGSAGVSGSFTTTDGKTITIKDGLVVSIV